MADPRARFAITADGSDYKRKLRAALRDTKTFAGSVRSALQTAGRRGAIGVGLATAGVVALTREANRNVDALAKQSQLLGITTEKLAAYQLATRLSGGTNQVFEKGLLKVQKAIVDAENGLTTYTRAFDALNLSPSQLATLTPDEQFNALGRAFAGVENQTRRLAIAYDLFGGRNTQLLNALVTTGTQLDKIEADTVAWGTALSAVDARKVEIANDEVERAQEALRGIANTVAVALAPLRGQLAKDFADGAAEADGFKSQIQSVFEAVVIGANFASNAVKGIQLAFLGAKLAALELKRLSGIDERRRQTLEAGQVPGIPQGAIPEDVAARLAREGLANLGPDVLDELDATGRAIDALVGKFQTAEQAVASFRAAQAEAAAAAAADIEAAPDPLTGIPEENIAAVLERSQERLVAFQEETQKRITAAVKRESDKRRQIEEQAERAIQQQKQQTADLAVGLLQAIGGRSRAFAIAALVLEKALAIQRLLLANRVAAELAFASQIIPGDPTSLARAQAAKAAVLAQGRVSAALIAATGVVQAAGLGEGSTGAPLGTPTNPLFTQQGGNDVTTGSNRRVIEVRLPQGGILTQRDFVRILKDAVDADEVFISAGSRQASEIRST